MGKTMIEGKTKAERTKSLIFESALTLFKRKGFEQTTIEEITSNAGLAKGSFYTYFSTKSDIIVEEFWAIDSYYRSIAPRLVELPTASEKLMKFTEYQMLYVRDTIGYETLKVLYANQVLKEGSDKVIVDKHRFWHTYIVEIIEEGQLSKEFMNTLDAQQLATYFNRAIRGLLLDWNIRSGSFDLVEEALQYCKVLLLGSLKN